LVCRCHLTGVERSVEVVLKVVSTKLHIYAGIIMWSEKGCLA
jgi:hypothetical protein